MNNPETSRSTTKDSLKDRESPGDYLLTNKAHYPWLGVYERASKKPIDTPEVALNAGGMLAEYLNRYDKKEIKVVAEEGRVTVVAVVSKEGSEETIPLVTVSKFDPLTSGQKTNLVSSLCQVKSVDGAPPMLRPDEYQGISVDLRKALSPRNGKQPRIGEPEALEGRIVPALPALEEVINLNGSHPTRGVASRALGTVAGLGGALAALRALPEAIDSTAERIEDGLELRSILHEIRSDSAAEQVVASAPPELKRRALALLEQNGQTRPGEEPRSMAIVIAMSTILEQQEEGAKAMRARELASVHAERAEAEVEAYKAYMRRADAIIRKNVSPWLRALGMGVGGIVPNVIGGFLTSAAEALENAAEKMRDIDGKLTIPTTLGVVGGIGLTSYELMLGVHVLAGPLWSHLVALPLAGLTLGWTLKVVVEKLQNQEWRIGRRGAASPRPVSSPEPQPPPVRPGGASFRPAPRPTMPGSQGARE